MALEGGCACGRMRYRLASKPMFVHCCHCRDCQRQTGSAFVINALIETDRIEKLMGETEGVPVPTPSGRLHVIHRCPACKVAVWSHYGGKQQLSFVRVGTLDEPYALQAGLDRAAPERSRLRGLLRFEDPVAGGKPRTPQGDFWIEPAT